MMNKANLLFLLVLAAAGSSLHATEMAEIQGGRYRPLYLKKDTPLISVKPFRLDKTPVTNAEFAQFVAQNPQWQRGRIDKRQAEERYLSQWVKNGNGYAPKAEDRNKPVTFVSWFAANAYCKTQGKRLPTIDEWEYVGQASTTQANGTTEKGYNQTILSWYENGGRRGLHDVGKDKPNYWGVHTMHGLIWECTDDFNSSLLSASSATSDAFCGGGAANSTDPSNYAAFMRFGIRTSLQSPFVLHNLGFRCAK